MTALPIHWHDRVETTQDEAHRLAAGGAPHGTTVAAREQSRGRGTRGRSWHAGPGGLWLSVVCRPDRLEAAEVAGVRVGLAVAGVLDRCLPAGPPVQLKWPNDLMLDGGKLGGILAEARWQGDTLLWMVLGVGLNVANVLPAGLVPPARRLADYAPGVASAALALPVAAAVAEAMRACPPLSPAEAAAFRARAWRETRGDA